jgi:hypothetical protein
LGGGIHEKEAKRGNRIVRKTFSHSRSIEKWGRAAQTPKNLLGRSNQIAGRELTQLVAQQFSDRALRQFVHEFDMSRVLVWRDAMFDELLQFEREIRSS